MISIITPVYNSEKFLPACVESILSQTFDDWELILVDDGSDDGSGETADAYAASDARIRCLHIENGGPARARNAALPYVRGEYISCVDSDDVLFPWSLQTLFEAIKSSGADIVAGCFMTGVEPGKPKHSSAPVRIFTPEDAVADLLYQRHFNTSPCGKLYKTSLFNDLQYRDGILYEDLDLVYRLFLMCGKVGFTAVPVYFYRMNPESILHTWSAKRLDVLDVTARIESFMNENHPSLRAAARSRRLSANFNMFALTEKHGQKDTADGCWEIIRAYRIEALSDPRVRLKNKAGALLSYLGRRIFSAVSGFIY